MGSVLASCDTVESERASDEPELNKVLKNFKKSYFFGISILIEGWMKVLLR
jgi:hypothetical protein